MKRFSQKTLWCLGLAAFSIFSMAGIAHSYTNIAINADGTPMKFQNLTSSSPLVWNPDSGPMQDSNSIHDFSNSTYAEYQSFCSGGGGGGSGSCSLDPMISEALASSAVTNAEGVALVTSAFNTWQSQATDASVSYSQGSALGEDVNVCNYADYIDSAVSQFAINGDANDPRVCGCLGTCGSPCTNPVVFDANGDITALESGEGNRYSILGSAGPVIWPGVNHFLKFEAIINGVCLDASPDEGCGGVSFSNDQLLSVMVHELGHAQGLGHTQVNPKSIGFTGGSATSPSGSAYLTSNATWGIQGAVPTMYPFLVSGDSQSSLMADDKTGLAHLYPSSNFNSSNYCALSGLVFSGSSAIRCTEVVFRDATSSSTSVLNAVSVISGGEAVNNGQGGVSGATWTSNANPGTNSCTASGDGCGAYSVRVPSGKTYNIEVNAIPNFPAGSTIGPCAINPSFSGVNQQGANSWTIKANGSVSCNSSGVVSDPTNNLSITLP